MDDALTFQNWVEQHEAVIVQLYREYVEETDDLRTSILEFSRKLYLETAHASRGAVRH